MICNELKEKQAQIDALTSGCSAQSLYRYLIDQGVPLTMWDCAHIERYWMQNKWSRIFKIIEKRKNNGNQDITKSKH